MLLVPTQPVPAQSFQVNLATQVCQINIAQKTSGLFMDLYLVGQPIPVVGGVLCQNLNRIVRDAYLGFAGDLVFFDTQAAEAPNFSGLGTRFKLAYLTAADLAEFGLEG